MSSLLLALTLMAWPPARGATVADLADAGNWPNEPEWSEAWPLYGFTPPGWSLSPAEADAGVGLSVDRAWAITRGAPAVILGVVAERHDLGDPVLARAWRLNAGELPDAGDLNGNGRLDVDDFTLPDVNGNGARDLEDLLAALADGVDQDGNGRTDDLCGWDFVRDAGIRSEVDAGAGAWRLLAAPVNDGRPGIGVCPECTLLPTVADRASLAAAIDFSIDAGVKALLLPASDDEVSGALQQAVARARASTLLVMPPLDGARLPLELGVVSPRTLTASSTRDTARSREGCDGRALPGQVSVSSTSCGPEAAARLVGVAGLVWSVNPGLSATQVLGLLGGPRVDAYQAVVVAEANVVPSVTLTPPLAPVELITPGSEALSCGLVIDGAPEVTTDCLRPGPWLPARVVRFVQRSGPSSWDTPVRPPGSPSLSMQALGAGSGPVRFVDLDGLFSDSVLAVSARGLVAAAPRSVEVLSADALDVGRSSPAVGDVNGDRVLDVVHAGDDGWLRAFSFAASAPAGFPERLPAPLAGPPLIIGSALVTLDVDGSLTHREGAERWTFELHAPQVSGPAAGRIDGDGVVDFAIANGRELRVLINDARGPTSASWSTASLATQAILGNLTGDDALEIVADAVYDARGQRLLELEGWRPAVVPPALARLDEGRARSLIQVEAAGTGTFELVRYDVERALGAGDSLAGKRLLFSTTSRPARGGFAVVDRDGDGAPDVVLALEDGVVHVVSGDGAEPSVPDLVAGEIWSSPAVGVADDQLQYAVRTTRGDLVRFLARGLVEDLSWEGLGHDRGHTWNAETPLPERRLTGLGVEQPPYFGPDCGCSATGGFSVLALLFLFRLRRSTC